MFFSRYSLVLQNWVSNAVSLSFFYFIFFSLFSSSSSAGPKAQRVQPSAQPLGSVPQPRTKRAPHAAQRYFPGLFSATQQSPIPPLAKQQLSKLAWKQQQHLPPFSSQLRPRKSFPDARYGQLMWLFRSDNVLDVTGIFIFLRNNAWLSANTCVQ